MREYETVFITQPNITESNQTQISEKINSLVEKHNGKLFFARNMGRKNLAYPINKVTKGIYTCVDFAANGTVIQDIERYLKYEDNVMRYMTVVKNEKVDVEARAAEIAARGEDVGMPFNDEVEKAAEVVAAAPAETADDSSDADDVDVSVAKKEE